MAAAAAVVISPFIELLTSEVTPTQYDSHLQIVKQAD